MSYEQYWERDPYLTRDYQQAHLLSVEQRNQELWLQGAYIHEAFSVVLANAFAKKGSRPKRYLSEPIRITPLTDLEKAEKAEREKKKFIESMTLWGKAWKAKHQDGYPHS